jgi:hypothetical protein
MTFKIRNTDAAERFKVIRASGVLVEQKISSTELARLLLPLVDKKEGIKRDCKQINKCEMEP